jgi:hypothetical protein
MTRSLWLCLLVACTPEGSAAPTVMPVTAPSATHATDACHADIPDCAAACALRETGRSDHLDWFDRRCAAVVLGRNPDKAVPPVATASTTVAVAGTTTPAPSGTGVGTTTPVLDRGFDPFTATRGSGSEPTECIAARKLIARGYIREAQALAALCEARGGDAGMPKDVLPRGADGGLDIFDRH